MKSQLLIEVKGIQLTNWALNDAHGGDGEI